MNKIPVYLQEKRQELVFALSLQSYSHSDIARIFGLNRSTVMRMIRDKPKDWQPKWVKTQE